MKRYHFLMLLMAASIGGLGFSVGRITAPTYKITQLTTETKRVAIPSAQPPMKLRPRKPEPWLKGSRLSRIEQLIAQMRVATWEELTALQHEYLIKEVNGYSLEAERRLIDYRMGQVNGPQSIRRAFTDDADRAVIARSSILEGWATADAPAALQWWSALPAGRMRDSLRPPLIQGLLVSPGGGWEMLESHLSTTEKNASIKVLFDHLLATKGLRGSMDWVFQHVVPGGALNYDSQEYICNEIHDHLMAFGDYEDMLHWITWATENANQPGYLPRSVEDKKAAFRKLGDLGGPKALEWILLSEQAKSLRLDQQLARVAVGWTDAHPDQAGAWLKTNTQHPAAEQVAFRLMVKAMNHNMPAAQQWRSYLQGELAERADEVLESQRARRQKESDDGSQK